MKSISRIVMSGAVVIATALLLTSPSNASGGTLRSATTSEPTPLDIMLTTASVTLSISTHIYEGLYALNSNFRPEPMLAESERVEDGGRTIVIALRKGVKFHNGKEMTSTDVVSSLNRWAKFGLRGKGLLGTGSSVTATGPYEVTIKLPEPNGAWKFLLATLEGGAAVYPAEVAEKATEKPIEQIEYIGTGPYKFKEWRPNRHVELVRFDSYVARSNPADGDAGKRVANFETIRFIPVPDVGTRVSGVKAGDYEYAEMISGDFFGQLSNDSSVAINKHSAPIFGLFFFNSKQGIFKDNYALRRAVTTALGKTDALRVSFGPKELWEAQGSIYPKGDFWYSEAGTAAYNNHDPAKAKQLAAAAGYDGKPIRLLVSTNFQTHYDQATVFVSQLAKAGINVQLIVVDWATIVKMRSDPTQYDIFVTHHARASDPSLLTFLNADYPGWWTSPEITALRKDLANTVGLAERKAVWDKIQTLFYEQVPAIKVGDAFAFDLMSPKLKGMSRPLIVPVFWNASFK
jgi:peptide/nickel transport system substrate-binding protein